MSAITIMTMTVFTDSETSDGDVYNCNYDNEKLVMGMSTTTIMTMTVFTDSETSDGDVYKCNYDNDGIYRN